MGKVFIMFTAMALFCFYIVMPQYSGSYNASLIDKVKRLESIEEPKIVLIGNSNVSFGINSERIEDAFGMPVINMGLHGGLGNAFHEEMCRINVREGDIYIICHSSFADDDTISDTVLAWSTVENHIELWKLLRPKDIPSMVKSYPTYFKKCLGLFSAEDGNRLSEGCYSRDAFNEYGDVSIDRISSMYIFEEPVTPPEIGKITVDRINKLNDWLEKKGAVLLIAGYPIGKGEFTAPEEEFVKVQNELSEELVCPFISDYRDYMFDYRMFYNTDLHLTTSGAELRTEQLIEDLKLWGL